MKKSSQSSLKLVILNAQKFDFLWKHVRSVHEGIKLYKSETLVRFFWCLIEPRKSISIPKLEPLLLLTKNWFEPFGTNTRFSMQKFYSGLNDK